MAVEVNVEVRLAVSKVADARSSLDVIAAASGGRVELERRVQGGMTVSLRVSAGNVERVLQALNGVGKLVGAPVSETEDLTSEILTIGERLQSARREIELRRAEVDSRSLSPEMAAVAEEQIRMKQAEATKLEADLQVLGSRAGTAVVTVTLLEGPAQ